MATNGKRDITLGVGIETTGVESLEQLTQEVKTLSAATEAARQKETAARANEAAARTETNARRDALARLTVGVDAAARSETGYQDTVNAAKRALTEARIAERDRADVRKAAAVEARTASIAEQAATAQVEKLAAAQRNAAAAALAQTEANAGLGGGVGGLAGGVGLLYAKVMALVGGLREWLDATVALDRLRRLLTTVTGSASEADKQIEFLRDTAQKTGQSFTQIAGEYGKFVAAAAASGIPLATVQKVFVGVSAAAGQLGLSSERTGLILGALGQMASKGTVGMEELRQQLGDSLPGALSLLAKGLGLADADLIKLVESGGLLARDALPALGTALTNFAAKGGEVEGITASWNRFKNVVLEAGTSIAEGPIGRAAGVVLGALAGVVRDLSVAAVGASEAFNVVGRTIALVTAALTGNLNSFRDFRNEFDQIIIDSGSKIEQFKSRAYGGAEATKALGAAATTAAPAITAHAAAMQQAGTAAQATAAAQTQAATATTAVGVAAQATGTQWYALKVAYDANIVSAEKTAKISEVLTKAKADEGKAAESLAKLTGDENEVRRVSADVATANAKAARDEADAVLTHARVLEAEHAALKAVALAENDLNDDRKKQLVTLQDKIDKTQAEAEKLNQAAHAQELASAATRQAIEVAKDNTFRHGEFAQAVDKARLALQAITIEMKAGRATGDDYARAVLDLSNAQGLLRDSILDADKHLQTYTASKKADVDVTVNGLKLKLEEAKTTERIATLHGNETDALRSKIVQKQIELQIALASAKAKAEEADETIRVTQTTLRDLAAIGQLTPEKQAELDLRIQTARAKKLEALAGIEATSAIQAEVVALQRHRAAAEAAVGATASVAAGFDQAAAAARRAEEATLRYGSALQSTKYDANKFALNADGSVFTAGGQLKPPDNSGAWQFVGDVRAGRSVSGPAGAVVVAGQGYWVSTAATSSTGSSTSTPTSNNGAAGTSLFTSQAARQDAANTSHTVKIEWPSGSATINTASESDASRLANTLRQLADDMGRAAA